MVISPGLLTIESVTPMDEMQHYNNWLSEFDARGTFSFLLSTSDGDNTQVDTNPYLSAYQATTSTMFISSFETQSWGHNKIRSDEAALAISTTFERSVKIAIIDPSGIDTDHPDLPLGRITWAVRVRYEFTDSSLNYQNKTIQVGLQHVDSSIDSQTNGSHATHILGIMGAEHNTFGVRGVNDQFQYYIIKPEAKSPVVNPESPVTFIQHLSFSLLQSFKITIRGPDGVLGTSDDPDVISMSFWIPDPFLGEDRRECFQSTFGDPLIGYDQSSQKTIINEFSSMISLAKSHNIVLVAAGGNFADESSCFSDLTFPARHPDVIGVVATTSQDSIAPFSNRGDSSEIGAPGVNIYSTIVGGYGYKSGT